ncbi:hypothetical protein [Sphingopyxis sp. 2PD]|uniref:hypothetical protein n=1 Tax=Sphingopyxis sp. 2PD TaxID=2502196 RepID=UPI0010F8C2E1|nr:hypothetical protein [Sphingopyxis sp. 2PD]
MLDVLGSEAIQAGRDLAIAGLVYLAFKTAREATSSSGRIPVMLKGTGFVLAIAAFAAFTLGNPSCDDGDPLFGSCAQSADDGFEASDAQRAGTFLYWLLLFGVPVGMGAMSARVDPLNPWGKPRKRFH